MKSFRKILSLFTGVEEGEVKAWLKKDLGEWVVPRPLIYFSGFKTNGFKSYLLIIKFAFRCVGTKNEYWLNTSN